MLSNITTVLFDADNTLLNFDKDENQALRRVMKKYGIPETEENISTYVRINQGLWKQIEKGEITKPELKKIRFRMFFEAIGFTPEKDPFLINEEYLSYLGEGGNTLEGAAEVCRKLEEKGYDLYIVTNGIEHTQKKRLTKSGLISYFTDIFVSETIGYQKPKREYFDAVLSSVKEKDKGKIIVIGDSLSSDIKGAMNAGLQCVWLNMKKAPLPEGYKPDYIINDIREVIK